MSHDGSRAAFAPLRVHAGDALDATSPGLEEFQRLLDRRAPPVRTASGRPLRLVPQAGRPDGFDKRYEPRIYLEGELQFRRGSAHDAFNVLAWLAFPEAKAALNARHYAALQAQRAAGAVNRGPVQDALTLFDESGVVMISADADLPRMARDFRWKDLFWRHRDRLQARARFFLFGHALCEQMLNPYRGLTGRGLLLEVEAALLAAPLAGQLAAVDARVAERLRDPSSLATTRELAVVPVLGVPGWHADNRREDFYDDTGYFRPGRGRELGDS